MSCLNIITLYLSWILKSAILRVKPNPSFPFRGSCVLLDPAGDGPRLDSGADGPHLRRPWGLPFGRPAQRAGTGTTYYLHSQFYCTVATTFLVQGVQGFYSLLSKYGHVVLPYLILPTTLILCPTLPCFGLESEKASDIINLVIVFKIIK